MSDHAYVAVPLALAAAASFAVSNVAQMSAVRHQPTDKPLGAGVVLRMLRNPLWLAGLLSSILGFVFEATALSVAPVVLVQPLIVAELPFALPLAALVAGRRLGRREWTGILCITFGLMALVAVIHPEDSPIVGPAHLWAILFGSVAAAVAALFVAGSASKGIASTSAYAAAAGTAFGLLAVITKATTHDFAARGFEALATWEPWALAAVGFVGLTLAQSAYRAGPLAVSLPLLDLGEPLVGSLIAVFAFGEQIGDLGIAASAVVAAAAASVIVGLAALDRSPLVLAAQGQLAGSRRD
jgi:drug/metabolite transporter (DMT)-like permease